MLTPVCNTRSAYFSNVSMSTNSLTPIILFQILLPYVEILYDAHYDAHDVMLLPRIKLFPVLSLDKLEALLLDSHPHLMLQRLKRLSHRQLAHLLTCSL